MKCSEAIKHLATMQKVCKNLLPPDEQDAISLAIGALRRIEHCRKWSYIAVREPLQGEDIENPLAHER